MDFKLITLAYHCKCPRCGIGDLYKTKFDLTLRERCPECDLDLARNDSADGPAVFLIFFFGGLLVPLALFVDYLYSPPLWVHAIVWGLLLLVATVGMIKPIKAYVIALQYKYRPGDWF